MRVFCFKNHKLTEDNLVLNAKNNQIRALKKVIEDQTDLIEQLSTSANAKRKGDVEDRLLDLVENFFVKPPKTAGSNTPATIPSALESGVKFTDTELKENLSRVPSHVLNQLKSDQTKFNAAVKTQVPNISNESLEKAYEIAHTM